MGSDAVGKDSARTEPAAKVTLTPRKATMPTGSREPVDDPSLRLAPTNKEPVWARRNRICPKSPKVPFEQPPRTVEAPGTQHPPEYVPRHAQRRGIIAFFRSRRKGRSRILNFILLPIAVVLAFLAILAMFKFL
ncbi:MAG: hypothetical protein WCH98_21635 [Verrucomicrobiota bacterium]